MRDIKRCGSVHFLHLRKAGGSSLRRALQQVCSFHEIPFVASEGRPLSHAELDDDTFLVTNSRDPLDRIFSLYNAEGFYLKQTKGKRVPFQQWLDPQTEIQVRQAPPLWRHTSNYHVRTFSDSGPERRSWEDIRTRGILQSDYHAAVVNLQRIDLPVVLEWLMRPAGVGLNPNIT